MSDPPLLADAPWDEHVITEGRDAGMVRLRYAGAKKIEIAVEPDKVEQGRQMMILLIAAGEGMK